LLSLSKLKKLMRKIQSGDNVKVHYTGKLEDGSIFDTSLTEGREPLETTLGQGQLIKGFEDGLIDMSEGDKKTVEIPCEQAYGEVNEQLISEVSKSQVPEGIEVGQMLQGMGPMGPINVTIVDITEESVKVDANHPLAGKKLIFDLEVVSIN
jgi:FKBP-type peptidyl-prolyl cis-trans isomerase SlpA